MWMPLSMQCTMLMATSVINRYRPDMRYHRKERRL